MYRKSVVVVVVVVVGWLYTPVSGSPRPLDKKTKDAFTQG